jgi:hypothetical protein
MKIGITNATSFIRRSHEGTGQFQWARETLVNAKEAGATKITFGVEWQAVAKYDVYRRTITDNGVGMSAEEMLRYFKDVGTGSKTIHSIHDNFGIGMRISTLGWNPNGVVIISYKNSKPSLAWMCLNKSKGEYELREFSEADSLGNVTTKIIIDPSDIEWGAEDIQWDQVTPAWAREHGTTIVLLGDDNSKDTILGDMESGENALRGLSLYLNSRFWDLSDNLEVRVAEFNTKERSNWPVSEEDSTQKTASGISKQSMRHCRGAKYYATEVAPRFSEGHLGAQGTFTVNDGLVGVSWYLWEGKRPAGIHPYAQEAGYIAFRYKGELFSLTRGLTDYRNFGVGEYDVLKNLTIIIDPPPTVDGIRWGVHPDQNRTRLVFSCEDYKSGDLPITSWGGQFAKEMPEEIKNAIRACRAKMEGGEVNEEYRKRLQDKFGSRWKESILIATPNRTAKSVPAKPVDQDQPSKTEASDPTPTRKSGGRKSTPTGKSRGEGPTKVKKKEQTRVEPSPSGQLFGIEVNKPVNIPNWRPAPVENFKAKWHIALWSPRDPEGPTVLINTNSPVIENSIKYFQDKYPDAFAAEIAKTVVAVFGEQAVCKIAHSQKLTAHISEEELDSDYRNDEALTLALMGLVAEETIIAQRLGRLGMKNPSMAAAAEALG